MQHLEISQTIQDALSSKKPIVALESTIITHGMPYPQNVETALRVEAMVRQHGAIPATIAILDGKMYAGLSIDQIEILGKTGQAVAKASRRDIPVLMAKKQHGATTVATTMIIAKLAGIKIFATGGIGGVHRGAEHTFDISADLQELSRTDVAVVCAGAKSILDLGLTLEYLETHGVPVLGYKTVDFPAFYTKKSGFRVDYQIDSAAEIALILQQKWSNPLLSGGVIIANPIPDEFSMNKGQMDRAIEKALEQAADKGIKGKEITPYLLAAIEKITDGQSLKSNIELVLNNARLAAEIATFM
jgi:pseudouridine-5'-phosphate glycosidase